MSECWRAHTVQSTQMLWRLHRLTEEEARFYVAEVVAALDHLHGLAIAYRDLKARLCMPLGAVRAQPLRLCPQLIHSASDCTGSLCSLGIYVTGD